MAPPPQLEPLRALQPELQPELALGAVSDGTQPETFIDQRLAERLSIPEDYVREETARQLARAMRSK